MERLRFRRLFFKWVRPRRFEIKRICQHHARSFVECACGNQILDAFARLFGHPIVDVNARLLRIFGEVDRLESARRKNFLPGPENFPEVVALLREKTVGDCQRDGLAGFFGFLPVCGGLISFPLPSLQRFL